MEEFKLSTNALPESVHAYPALDGVERVGVMWRPSYTVSNNFTVTAEAFAAIFLAARLSKAEGRIVEIKEVHCGHKGVHAHAIADMGIGESYAKPRPTNCPGNALEKLARVINIPVVFQTVIDDEDKARAEVIERLVVGKFRDEYRNLDLTPEDRMKAGLRMEGAKEAARLLRERIQ